MVGLAPSDLIILIIVAVILFAGASKIPEIFRSLGRATGEFKKGKMEAEMELMQMQQAQNQNFQQPQSSKEAELQRKIEELQKQLEELKKQQRQQNS
ncbi:twin-arginine translocase TatA/TatE family subunit [Stygiolobus azoricus]|uniref:Twin-arginine translocase TatA/TatE family subunit n=1 Tax=Stygiolobus azoricus TaxID=41675 RepID=A0A650CLQ7_9CREN|nr:twin-arginine translocase TatA/TatE family subunit [Stygiolobus azoricus]QGR18739.1 twin-arginine translocase TatA/TatE family subunit [Stygiolobus azoricus]